jgi:hypothetical protein
MTIYNDPFQINKDPDKVLSRNENDDYELLLIANLHKNTMRMIRELEEKTKI